MFLLLLMGEENVGLPLKGTTTLSIRTISLTTPQLKGLICTTQHNNALSVCHYLSVAFFFIVMLIVITLCCYTECHFAECCYAECHFAECCFAECLYAECYYA
jgi:hypothetical protein